MSNNKRTPPKVRFLRQLEKLDTGCWKWQAYILPSGYGLFTFEIGDRVLTHRASWRIFHGPIPNGLWVLHKCDNRWCVNPEHLWLGTHADNMKDMVQKGRQRKIWKLLPSEVIEIRTSREGSKLEAEKYNVSQRLINYVRHGDIWRSI